MKLPKAKASASVHLLTIAGLRPSARRNWTAAKLIGWNNHTSTAYSAAKTAIWERVRVSNLVVSLRVSLGSTGVVISGLPPDSGVSYSATGGRPHSRASTRPDERRI